MFTSGVFDYINLLGRAADVSSYRNEILTNNIANATTPGYKRKDVDFELSLSRALESAAPEGSTLTQKVHNIDLDTAKATVYTDNSTLSYRLDGNNVDMSVEEMEHASNQLLYEGLIDSMNAEFNRIKAVLK